MGIEELSITYSGERSGFCQNAKTRPLGTGFVCARGGT